MAITKTGQAILIKLADVDFDNNADGPMFAGKNSSKFSRFMMPVMFAAPAAMAVAAGDQSIGGAVGETAASYAGWELGSKAVDKVWKKPAQFETMKLTQKMKSPKWWGRGILGLGASFAGSALLGGVGDYVGDKIIPWKRKMPTIGQQPTPFGDS